MVRLTKNNCKIAGDFLGCRWRFQETWGPWLISELGIWLFEEHDYMSKLEIWGFRPVTINPKNRPATQKGFGSDSDNRPTLLHYTSKFLPKYRFMAHCKNLVWKKFHGLQHSRVWTRIRLQIEPSCVQKLACWMLTSWQIHQKKSRQHVQFFFISIQKYRLKFCEFGKSKDSVWASLFYGGNLPKVTLITEFGKNLKFIPNFAQF
jgi:hypothetical protein